MEHTEIIIRHFRGKELIHSDYTKSLLCLMNDADAFYSDIMNKTLNTKSRSVPYTFTEYDLTRLGNDIFIIANDINIGIPVGMIWISENIKCANEIYIESTYVLTGYRRMKIGSRMAEEALAYARMNHNKITLSILNGNEEAKLFWNDFFIKNIGEGNMKMMFSDYYIDVDF